MISAYSAAIPRRDAGPDDAAPADAGLPAPVPGTPEFDAILDRGRLTPEERLAVTLACGGTERDAGLAFASDAPTDGEAGGAGADAPAAPHCGSVFVGDPREIYADPADCAPVRMQSRRDGWAPEVQRHFLSVLAETGCVSHACRAVGRSRSSAYALRARADAAAFSEAWDAALRQACHALTDTLWERAMEGQEEVVTGADGAVKAVRRRHDNRLAMWLLSHHDPVFYGDLRDKPVPPEMRRRGDRLRFAARLNALVRRGLRRGARREVGD